MNRDSCSGAVPTLQGLSGSGPCGKIDIHAEGSTVERHLPLAWGRAVLYSNLTLATILASTPPTRGKQEQKHLLNFFH